MSKVLQFKLIKSHLERSRKQLLEKAESYRFIDETISDNAAYKAMKLSRRIDQLKYLEPALV